MSPAIAQTLAQLGIDTSSAQTLRRLSDALKQVQHDLSQAQRSSAPGSATP